MKVRALLACTRIQQQLSGAADLTFSATYPQSEGSDLDGELTRGLLTMTLTQAAADQIYVGKEYSLELTEAPAA